MLLTAAEVQERLRVSRDTVFRLIAAGDLKAHKVGSGRNSRYRIDEADLQVFLDRAAERAKAEAST